MKTKIIASTLSSLLICGAAFADEIGEDWLEVASTSEFQWLGKKKSGEFTTLDNKKNNAYRYVIQKLDKKEKTYQYSQVIVELNACKKGYGYVYYNNMEGKYTGHGAFVRFGPTVADALGTMACLSWDHDTGKQSMVAKENAWEEVAVAGKSGNKWSLKNDTVRKVSYNNKPAVSVLFSYQSIAKKTVEYNEFVFLLSDCKRGYGVAYEQDFNGKLVEKNDVVLNGDSVLSSTITALCSKI